MAPYQEMVDEVSSLTEYELIGLEVIRVQCLANQIDCTDQVLFHDGVLSHHAHTI